MRADYEGVDPVFLGTPKLDQLRPAPSEAAWYGMSLVRRALEEALDEVS